MHPPIYLFADSQLLFWKENGLPFLSCTRKWLRHNPAKAAYLGASNGDQPEFYELFKAAMSVVDIQNCRAISASFDSGDRSFMNEADLILLAGGDIERGWRFFQESGLDELLVKRHQAGAVLMGISAGAAQLGLSGWKTASPASDDLFDTLGLVPFVVGAHEERENWASLQKVISCKPDQIEGIGIPGGAGMIYYGDKTIEPIRHPLHRFFRVGEEVRSDHLFPPTTPNRTFPSKEWPD